MQNIKIRDHLEDVGISVFAVICLVCGISEGVKIMIKNRTVLIVLFAGVLIAFGAVTTWEKHYNQTTLTNKLPKRDVSLEGGLDPVERLRREKIAAQAAKYRQEREKDRQKALSMGIAYETYLKGKDNEAVAHLLCQQKVMEHALWSGSSRDWFGNYTWSINGSEILVDGRDVTLRNGLGASRRVGYSCVFDLASETATVTAMR